MSSAAGGSRERRREEACPPQTATAQDWAPTSPDPAAPGQPRQVLRTQRLREGRALLKVTQPLEDKAELDLPLKATWS